MGASVNNLQKQKQALNDLMDYFFSKQWIDDERCYDTLLSVFEELTFDQFQSLRENYFFSEFLKTISVFYKSPVVGMENHEHNLNQDNILFLPSPKTKIKLAVFNNEFDKLTLRIRRAVDDKFGVGKHKVENLADILSMEEAFISNLPGVGFRYVESWKKLISTYQKHETFQEINDPDEAFDNIFFTDFRIDDIELIYSQFNDDEEKALEKMTKLNPTFSVKDVVEFSGEDYKDIKGVGKKYIISMNNVKVLVIKELRRFFDREINIDKCESFLLRPKVLKDISIEAMSNILLEDIEAFIDRQPEDVQDIFGRRWGFGVSKATLEEIGNSHELTKERIRQKEKVINYSLFKCFRINEKSILNLIESKINNKLPDEMLNLSRCFDSEKNFFEFLGFICGGIDIAKLIRPNIPLDLLGDFFETRGAPCVYGEVNDYIEEYSLIQEEGISVSNAIKLLEEHERLKLDGEYIYPRNLKKEQAAACVLYAHANGLPWKDIAMLVNSGGYSRTNLHTERPDYAALSGSENIFLSGKGVYKHIRFVGIENLNVDLIFDEVLKVFADDNRSVIHLSEICRFSEHLKSIDYYSVRYLMKSIGENYGFYFDGKSQSDSVGIQKNFKNVTQKDVILQAMKTNAKPMTKAEIADLLKSKSLRHASFYLDQMIQAQEIVQVDRMLYTTPELAYSEIDTESILNQIEIVLKMAHKPVDPSVFEVEINKRLNEAYSRFFYAAIAKANAETKGWQRKQNLYSLGNIPYRNLMNAIDSVCSINFTIEENYIRLEKVVAVTKEKASISIGQWVRDVGRKTLS